MRPLPACRSKEMMPAIFSDSSLCWRANERHAMLLLLDLSRSSAADSQLFGSCTPLKGQSPLHSEKLRDPVLPRIN